MSYLVTGAAGFIGFHVAHALLAMGEQVVGVDNLNAYYPVELKRDRLKQLTEHKRFSFRQIDIADANALFDALRGVDIRDVIHLAAQPGVRYGLDHPQAYVQSNLVGHLNVLEFCRHRENIACIAYASSSSVYGGSAKMPSSETDVVDKPISLYAATKKADELMSHAYSHLFGLPLIGLRFFTVYGPWGRPDMAPWLFTKAILAGEPLKVFHYGKMRRDFTYIDDIVDGVLKIVAEPHKAWQDASRHRIYNIGNNRPEELMHFINVLEDALGRSARLEMLPLQPGDVVETCADIDAIRRDYGFEPKTPIAKGVSAFVDWYRAYHAGR